MSRGKKRSGILIIGDSRAFGRVIRAMLSRKNDLAPVMRETTYDDCRGVLTPRVVRETALFIIELWRNYPTGMRAEGVAVAEQLILLGATPLIVSPLSLGEEADTIFYWDISSKDTLGERCSTLLSGRFLGSPRSQGNIASLTRLLDEYLAKQVGHT